MWWFLHLRPELRADVDHASRGVRTALTGFFISLNLFFIAFLRREAKVGWTQVALLTVLADLMLMFLSWLMTLDLPEGLLQHAIDDLPWPLGPI